MHRDGRYGSCRSLSPPFCEHVDYRGCSASCQLAPWAYGSLITAHRRDGARLNRDFDVKSDEQGIAILLGNCLHKQGFPNQALLDIIASIRSFFSSSAPGQRTSRSPIPAHSDSLSRFTWYEYFITDKMGHAQDHEAARRVLPMLARFIRSLLAKLDLKRTTVILTSDHGNIEDLSVRNHTLHQVPTLVWGEHRERLARASVV